MTTHSPVSGVIDSHVHLMPESLLAAIRRAIRQEAGWTFDHPTAREAMETALRAAGVEGYFALPYAHKPGIAADLNEWVLTAAADSDMAVPFATVHGDDNVADVVRAAFDAGARGLKFQCPVQESGPTDPRLEPAFELAAAYDRPIVFHAGTAPLYEDSSHVGADQFEAFVETYPDVRACAAHMGMYEADRFIEFARDYDSVFLDTAYVLSNEAGDDMGVDPASITDQAYESVSDSVMYGTDYPNLTFPYRVQLDALLARDLTDSAITDIVRQTAERFVGP